MFTQKYMIIVIRNIHPRGAIRCFISFQFTELRYAIGYSETWNVLFEWLVISNQILIIQFVLFQFCGYYIHVRCLDSFWFL